MCVMTQEGEKFLPKIDHTLQLSAIFCDLLANCSSKASALARSELSSACWASVFGYWASASALSAAVASAAVAVLGPVAPLLGQSKYAACGNRF